MTIRILVITNELKYVCGVSNHIKQFINGFYEKHNEYKFYLLCGNLESVEIINQYKCVVLTNTNILHNKRSLLNFLKSILFVKRIIKKYNINIIHSQNHYAANIAYYASLFGNVKTVQTNNGLLSEVGILNHFKANFYLVLSDRIRNYMVNKQKTSPEKIFSMKYGINSPVVNTQKLQNNKLLVLAASRFEKIKGLDLYIKVAGNIKHKMKDVDFVMSGNGSEKSNLFNLNLQNGNVVSFIDPVNDYKETIRNANIFVFPTRSTEEGLPIVLIEAIMNDCLIVSSDFDGYKDIFPNGYTDLIFRSDDLNDLNDKLIYAIKNYRVLINYYKDFYDKIRDSFSVNNMIKAHHDLYMKIYKSNYFL